jgi:Flp pilus assembly protein TadB
VAGGIGLLVWAVSGWPVAGALVTATVVGLPVLLGTSTVAARRIGRVEAIEEWTRRLSDVLVAGVGLEQALIASLRTCPPALRTEVTALVARLSARWPTERALRAFADDVDDAAADLVVAALVLAARRRGPGLARVLTAVADSVAEDVSVRRKVEAERAKPRTTARGVTLITLGVVAVGALNGTYLSPYAGPLGQAVLAAIATAFIGCLAWMRALTLSPPEPRFLTGDRAVNS